MDAQYTHETQTVSLSVGDIIKQGWSKIDGLKKMVTLTVIGFIVITAILKFIQHKQTGIFAGIDLFILQLFNWYFIALLMTIGTRQALGMPPLFKAAFESCTNAWLPLLALWVIYVIVAIFAIALISAGVFFLMGKGTLLLILVGIVAYLLLLYVMSIVIIFAAPALIIYRSPIFLALKTGFHAANKNYLKLLCTNIVMVCIVVISAIPFGIGLIWTLPMAWTINGIWFKEACTKTA